MEFELKGTENLNDQERMDLVLKFVKSQLKTEGDKIALMSNISAIIMTLIKDLNWVGFYLVKGQELVLGPFQGLPACTRLPYNEGVCARAWSEGQMQVVDDVLAFPGHIACDSNSRSELVVPLFNDDQVYGVLDLDSPSLARFTPIEIQGFEDLARMIEDYLY